MFDRLLLLCEKYPLDFITYFCSSLPIFSGFIRYKYLSSLAKLIIIFFLFFAIKETISISYSLFDKNNLYLENIESISYILILLAISWLSTDNVAWKRITVILATVCLTASLFTYQSDSISPIGPSAFRLFAIFICLSYFNKILTDISIKNILLHTMFWFISGLLFYTAGTFFIMLFNGYWYKDIKLVPAETFDKYWNSSQLLFIAFCVLSAYGLWLSKYDKENLT
ncbi:hypothetical protein IC229_24685 [Spirosoma sp. BT702]|uniref:Uncharacterized protein n=1 Tax=Spirosoma profusum TaxID=2771354 RepID=A0A926Y509_9BACT|nr:hypothetical protein [Spirosoma profusum]MBD2703866.1 hypothetical protein [Spirosoma profusum]